VISFTEEEPITDAITDQIFRTNNFSTLALREDHASRPLWVCENNRIFLETFSPLYTQAYDFLIAIAEPLSRLRIMHEYKITEFSLYAAISVGLTREKIIELLERFSKVSVPPKVLDFITKKTEAFGKISVVLRQNKCFLEAKRLEILVELQKDPVIRNAQEPGTEFTKSLSKRINVGVGAVDSAADVPQDMADADDDGGFIPEEFWSIQIQRSKITDVKKQCIKAHQLSPSEEYDFSNDSANPPIKIDLKPSTTLRPYQETSLSKMFGNGRARSGIIVLPCGAGKTLVGVTAACTIQRRCIVLTTNSVSVKQWKAQFLQWSTIADHHVTCFTSQSKADEITDDTQIIVTTYTMLSHSGKRAVGATKMLNKIKEQEWGLLILDEVHVAPADGFARGLQICPARCKLGLTATLVREDEGIEDLNFLIGTKLYEANWLDLSRAGHIATVSCAEVWCDMTAEFFREWISVSESKLQKRKKRQISAVNPNKFRICEFLIKYHEGRGDKILVFADDVFALQHYATTLGKIYLFGETSERERTEALESFKYTNNSNTIFISRIGDNAIDLPEANVLIQISSHYGARRQEAQRLGRILRAKAKTNSEYNAYFYTLISKYTEEMAYSIKRQRFLVNQGFSYRIITEIPEMNDVDLHYGTKKEQLQLLSTVITASCEKEKLDVHDQVKVTRKKFGRSSNLSGGTGRSYNNVNPLDLRSQASLMPKRGKPKR